MAGRQVFEVSPTSVGGSLYTVAVSSRGYDVQKALESTSTLIIEFRDDEEKSAWLKALVQATYRASAPPKIDILGESITSLSESGGAHPINIGSADLVINGTLVETKLLMYGKLDRVHEKVEEELILELLGGGGKVKGYINEVVVRIEDEDERISSLAKLFFHELSKKGSNPIYNLLPSIFGRLSSQNLKEEAFRNIMQF